MITITGLILITCVQFFFLFASSQHFFLLIVWLQNRFQWISFCDHGFIKVHIFREGQKILRNLPLTFDYSSYSQKLGKDFAKFCGLLRIYELYASIWIFKVE